MTNFIRLYPPGRKIANNTTMWTRGKEGGKQGGNWIGLKEGDILCRKCNQWKTKRSERGQEQSAAYQWTHGVKQKGKVTKVSHN